MAKGKVRFYCVKGKHTVETKEWKTTKMKNGRKAYTARCPDHDIKLFRIAGHELDSKI